VEGVEYATRQDFPYAEQPKVTEGYFRAMGIRLLSGRSFSESDVAGGEPVAIVSKGLADRYWMRNQRILWGRVILYGILVEAVLTAVFIAGLAAGVMSPGMTTALALVGSFLLPLLFAASLGKRLQARFALHGMLIGAIAFAVFMTMSVIGRFFQPSSSGRRYFARNTHSDTASPTPAATITNSSFQGNGYAVRVRLAFVAPAFTVAGLTRTRNTGVLASVFTPSISTPDTRTRTGSPTRAVGALSRT
jgi:hypothetical protein